ncbi:helix-turn-helix transcriptional regulator [Streptomyces sp. PTM05]|uniref:Helix-turn-helix transcriptional regulator n=1 Tax=Streptantibioticus parmotrematis TaxID=2873249 RepID=A0ABS7QTZ6_9ACTN|nr:helix-turn-helix transcriptional regulator [Streptantibioticus parmotrematis]MBY8886672.1 helix-turn-helix transcriptional regulator [Streptantibioticus parmotrematis]
MTVEAKDLQTAPSLLAFFGTELQRVRNKAGWSQSKTAKAAHTTQAMVSYIESGERVPSADLARDLDLAFDTDGHFGRLLPLVIRYAYPGWFLPYVELERAATSIRSFEGQVIPGLLQTEGYARAVLSVVRPDNLDDLVAARMTRQDILTREDRPRTWFVIDEYVLERRIGGPAVMRAQLERLLEAGQHPRTVIQLIEKKRAAHPGLNGPFSMMSFAEGADVLWVDGFSQGRAALDAQEVVEGARTYDLLRAVAKSPEASADLIREHLEGLSHEQSK